MMVLHTPKDNMKKLFSSILFATLAWSTLGFAADAPTPVRIAILVGNGERAPAELIIAELEAALTEVEDVTLLEREEIHKVLDEQKISASGFTDPATAVRLGKLLSVELFLPIDKIPTSDPEAYRIQAVDAKTGIALAGQMVIASDLVNGTPILDLIKTVLTKHRIPLDQRHYVSILDVRSEEAGPLLDPLASALWMFLTTDLQESPELTLLDREHLNWLREEKELTEIQTALKTSALLLECGIRRSPDGKKITLTLLLRPLAGGEPERIEIDFRPENIADARKRMVDAIGDRLKLKPVERKATDPEKEAHWYADQADLMVKTGAADAAVRAAEAAYALWPDRKTRLALVQAHANHPRIYPYTRWKAEGSHPLKNLTVKEQLAFFRTRLRIYEFLVQQYELDFAIVKDASFAGCPRYMWGLEFEEYVGLGIVNQEVAPEAQPLQQQVAALERKLFDILIAAALRNPRNHGWACSRAFYDAARRLHTHSPALAPRIAAGWAELLKIWSEGARNPETADQFSESLLSGSHIIVNGEPERRFYVEALRPFAEDPHPKVRRAAIRMLFKADPTPEWAEALLKVVLSDERSQEKETHNIGYYTDQARQAYTTLRETNPPLAHEYAEKILSPFLLQGGDACRLLDYRALALEWLKSPEVSESPTLCERMIEATHRAFRLRPDKDRRESRLFLRVLEEYQGELGINSLDAPRSDDPWDEYDIRRLGLKMKGRASAVALQGGYLYCMVRDPFARDPDGQRTVEFTVSVHDFPNGGPPIQTEVLTPEQHLSAVPCVWGAVIDDRVYFNTCAGLLTLKHGEPMRLLTEADGLPGPRIEAMAVFKNKLYLYALDVDQKRRTFARYDPATDTSETIYSNTSVEPSKQGDINIRAIVPDEDRESCWLIAENATLYRFNLQPKELVEVTRKLSYRLGLPGSYRACLTPEGLFYSSVFGVALLDLETYELTYLLHYTNSPDGKPPVFGNPTIHFRPALYDGEIILTGGWYSYETRLVPGEKEKPYLYMLRRGHEPSPCKEVYGIRLLTETPHGILAAGDDGDAWLMRKK